MIMSVHNSGSETCAESPDECSIDRVSSLNGEGECEFQCTIGYSGQLCNGEL